MYFAFDDHHHKIANKKKNDYKKMKVNQGKKLNNYICVIVIPKI